MTPIPLAALEHVRYCQRQCALILVDGQWVDNEHTVRGTRGHRRADRPSQRMERGRKVLRALPVHSHRLGLVGRADAVELYDDGSIHPVEYKIGSRHGDMADVQLCGIALCLEEMTGAAITDGAVWYAGTRQRVNVRFDSDLRDRTLAAIEEVRRVRESEQLPPAPADDRCHSCQFEPSCLPSLVADPDRVVTYVLEEVEACDS
jgi:CRISPR-associated exonuclease Cas4